jgi:hypothetical protein
MRSRSSRICDGVEVGRAIHPSAAAILRSTAGAILGRSGEAACGSWLPPATQTGVGCDVGGSISTS